MNKNQKGFSILIIVIIILTSGLVGGVGYYVYKTKINNQKSEMIPNFEQDPSVTPTSNNGTRVPADIEKPIIYLYPTKTLEVKVRLDYNGTLTSTYPDYDKNISGWDVIANPDGSLVNKADNKPYSYIFWEGTNIKSKYDFSSGFVVEGSKTKEFLQSILAQMGLIPKEYNEMIVYWLPQMENNKYNLIHFAGKEYTDSARLTISPTPDSVLRVFMVFKPLSKNQDVKPQFIKPFERKGFTVIEWGGTKL